MAKSRTRLFGILGVSFTFMGIVLGWYGFPKIVKFAINMQISLNNGTLMYPMWVKLPVPLFFNARLFNVTNPDEVSKGAKPIVREMGPYCYDEFLEKIILAVDDEQDTITYGVSRILQKADRPGCASDQDIITVLNVGLLGIVKKVNQLFPDLLSAVDEAIPLLFPGITTVFTTAKVRDLLFDGVLLDCSAADEDFTLDMVCKTIKSQAPPNVRRHPNGRDYLFSYFSYINGTDQGNFTVYRGNKDINMLGSIIEWNGLKETPMWRDDCRRIVGTDSMIFPPLNNASEMFAFQPDVCRSLFIKQVNHTVTSGIPTIKYTVTPDLFSRTEENECFCNKHKDEETGEESLDCLKEGTLQLDPCLDAAVVATWPHFIYADEEYSNYVLGLNPDPEKHLTVAEIEPMLGAPIKGYKRLQLNMYMEQLEDITVLEEVSEGMFPILWLEEGAELPDSLLSLISLVYTILKALSVLKWLMVLSGLGLIAAAIYLYTKSNQILCFSKQTQIADVNFDLKTDGGPDQHRESVALGTNLTAGTNRFDTMQGIDNPQMINKFNINQLRNELNQQRGLQNFNSYGNNAHPNIPTISY